MQKIKVGVLMGGKSKECEVSLNSGRTICDHLDTECYDIIPIFQTTTGLLYILPWSFLHRGKIIDFEHRLAQEAKHIKWDTLKQFVDFIYIAQHGRFAEDGTMQGMLELLHIPYFGSKVLASALGMDKIIQKKILRSDDIQVPFGIVITPPLNHETILKQLKQSSLNFPLIVKPTKEGSSLGTSVVKNEKELFVAIRIAMHINKIPQEVLIEEKIEGMEFSCIVITDNKTNKFVPLPPTEIVTPQEIAFFDYEQKYMPGKSLQYTPARCTQEQQVLIQQTCLQVMNVLEFSNLGRIDGFLTKDNNVVIIDPNSFSGAAPSSFMFKQAAEINLNHTQLINHLIKTELHAYNMIKNEKSNGSMKKNEKKIRVAVLLGGKSDEKEISLESGRNVIYKLSPEKYEAIPLFLSSNLELFQLNARLLVSNSTQEIEALLKPEMQINWHDLPTIADFVFIGLHGGEGENGNVQGALELLGIPYNGSSVLTSALCMNKYKTNNFLKHEGFEIPKSQLIIKNNWQANKQPILSTIKKEITLPCIVKPSDSGCSTFVTKPENKADLAKQLEIIFKHKTEALVEEYINGMELTVGVIGNQHPQALPPSYAVSQKSILSIEEKFLPGTGENQTPAPLPKKALNLVKKTIEQVYKTLECKGYSRIDCFYQTAGESPSKKERVVILEVNTLPGLTPATCIFHQAAEIGLKPMDFIDKIVELGFEQHGKSNKKKKNKKNSLIPLSKSLKRKEYQ